MVISVLQLDLPYLPRVLGPTYILFFLLPLVTQTFLRTKLSYFKSKCTFLSLINLPPHPVQCYLLCFQGYGSRLIPAPHSNEYFSTDAHSGRTPSAHWDGARRLLRWHIVAQKSAADAVWPTNIPGRLRTQVNTILDLIIHSFSWHLLLALIDTPIQNEYILIFC